MTPPVHTADELAAALGVLRVTPPADWEDVRSAYRNELMAAHPDTAGAADNDGRTNEIVAAFRLLREATQDGHLPLAAIMAQAAAVQVATQALVPAVVLQAAPGDVYSRVHEAVSFEGEISGLDRTAGLIQAVVNTPGYAASQLTAEVTPTGSGDAQVLFTLEPLGLGEAPPLDALVQRLGVRLG